MCNVDTAQKGDAKDAGESEEKPSDPDNKIVISSWSDIFIAHPTVPGYMSKHGSFFLQYMYLVFCKCARCKDLDEMLREVTAEMEKHSSQDGGRQSVTFAHRGCWKRLYFNPGLYTGHPLNQPQTPPQS